MKYSVSTMVKEVRVAIDMNRGDALLLTDEDCDTLSLDELIKSKLADAARLVEMEAPQRMLESGHDFGDNVAVYDDGKGYAILPHDFMRLICFRMSDWKRGVHEAISESDPAYSLMSSKYKGISGSPEKPLVAIVRRAEGKVLEFSSSHDGTATVAQATYQPYPAIGNDGKIDIAEECYSAAVYRAAALTLASLGDQQSATMLEMSRSFLNQ